MTKYEWIRDKKNHQLEMDVKYNGGTGGNGWRTMWPMLIGRSPDPDHLPNLEDVVLCFHPQGTTSRKWRCLRLAKITDYQDPTHPDNQRPLDLLPGQISRQTSVVYPDMST
jgi:hypothetical protein